LKKAVRTFCDGTSSRCSHFKPGAPRNRAGSSSDLTAIPKWSIFLIMVFPFSKFRRFSARAMRFQQQLCRAHRGSFSTPDKRFF